MDISVIIPIYNVSEYLTECLDSVHDNVKKLDAEVLLIDDGSTDKSPEIADAYAKKSKKFHYHRKENGGLSSARNYGENLAKGDYIIFVDSDDLLTEGILEKMFSAAKHNDSDVTTCEMAKLQDGKIVTSDIHSRAFYGLKGAVSHIKKHPGLVYDSTACNKLIKRSFYEDHQFAFPEGRRYEDIPVITPMLYQANAVSVIRQIGYLWRIRTGNKKSITQSYHEKKSLTDKIAMIGETLDYFTKDIHAPEIRSALENKAVKTDFTGFINNLEDMQECDAQEYVDLIADFTEKYISKDVLEHLSVIYRQTYRYILDRNVTALKQLVRYKKANYFQAPICETEDGLKLKLREEYFTIPDRRIDREFVDDPPRCMVDSVSINGYKVILKGHIYTRRIHISDPSQQQISAYMMNEVTGNMLELEATSCESTFLTEEQGTMMNYDDYTYYHYNHDGAGFLITLEFDQIQQKYPNPGDVVIFIRFANHVIEGERILRGIKASARKKVKEFKYHHADMVKTIRFDARDTIVIRTQKNREEKKDRGKEQRNRVKKAIKKIRK